MIIKIILVQPYMESAASVRSEPLIQARVSFRTLPKKGSVYADISISISVSNGTEIKRVRNRSCSCSLRWDGSVSC